MRVWMCAALLAGCCVGMPAWAHPELDAAKELFEKADVRGALKRLDRAERSPSKTEDEIVEMHWYRAACLHALHKEADATRSFDAVLELRPLYEPDTRAFPPELRNAFQKRATAYKAERGVLLGPPVLDGNRMAVAVTRFPEKVARVIVFVRGARAGAFLPFPLTVSSGEARGTIGDRTLWEEARASGKLSVVVEAQSAREVPLARLGDAVRPLELSVDARTVDAALAIFATPPTPKTEAAPPPPKESSSQTVRVDESGPSPRVMAGRGVLAASLGLLAVAALLLAGGVASFAALGASLVAQTQVKGIEVLPIYPPLIWIYQGAIFPALAFSGLALLVLPVCVLFGAVGVVLLVVG